MPTQKLVTSGNLGPDFDFGTIVPNRITGIPAWANIQNRPTTIEGYAITDGANRATTIAGLRTIVAPIDGAVALTAGFSTVSDGGGALWRYDATSTAADDGLFTIVPNAGGGGWKRVWSDGIDCRSLGVFANGSDASFPLQTAVTACAAVGAALLVPYTPGAAVIINAPIYLPSNTTIRGVGAAKPELKRTALVASKEGGLLVRDPSGVAAISNVTVANLKITYADPTGKSIVSTAGQTTFAFANTATMIQDIIVVWRSAGGTSVKVLSPSTPDYSYTSTNVTVQVGAGKSLTSPPAAGDTIMIAQIPASARNAALLSEGPSATTLNRNISFIDIEANGNWYVGIENMRTDNFKAIRCTSTGVVNRGGYQYCMASDASWVDFSADGRPTSGVFNGVSLTDYLTDNNPAGDGTPTNVLWTNLTAKYGFGRAWSCSGLMTGCRIDGLYAYFPGYYGVLVQDANSSNPLGVVCTNLNIIGASIYGIRSMGSACTFDNFDVSGTHQIGVYCDQGAVGSLETEIRVSNGRVAGSTYQGVLMNNIYYTTISQVNVIACGSNGVEVDNSQLMIINGLVSRSNGADGLSIGAGVYRVIASDLMCTSNTFYGVRNASGNFGNQFSGHSFNNTAGNLLDNGASSDVSRLLVT